MLDVEEEGEEILCNLVDVTRVLEEHTAFIIRVEE
jgi:hypothetical protein